MKIFLFILIYFSLQLSAIDLISLRGNAVQGGLAICELDSSVEKLFLDHKPVPISNTSAIIGFDRDEKLKHKLTIVLKNGEMYTSVFYIKKKDYSIQRIDNIEEQYVEQPHDQQLIERISSEASKLLKSKNKIYKNKNLYIEDFHFPLDSREITGYFGTQRILNGIHKKPHNGLDIAAPSGTEIIAMTTGVVKLTGDYFYNGRFVLLDHGSGLSSIYIHLSSISVEVGDYILAGGKIGEVGSTGRSSGNHLHWGVGWRQKRIDPEQITNMEDTFLKIIRE